ncbi:MAG: alpha/beta fold hydrolase [Longimicrobiaceae bacterium]
MRAPVNGAELFYTTYGRGRPMLLMHGGLGYDHTYLRPWLDALGEQAELIYYDHRGNGRSSRPENWEGITHETWAEDADALREHLGHERVLLFGHSYGGFLAQEYALRYPQRLHGLILCSTAPVFDYPEVAMANARARGTAAQFQTLAEALSAPVGDDEALRELTFQLLPLYFHRPDPERMAGLFAETRYSAAAYNHATFRCLASFNVVDRLKEIRVPTLVLGGRDDWIFPPAQAPMRLHAGLPGAELVLFEQSGHYPFVEQPGEFITAVADWIARLG